MKMESHACDITDKLIFIQTHKHNT